MGTVIFQDGFSILIRSKEGKHKRFPHCHAVGQGHEARIHLETFEVLTNTGFGKNDLRKIVAAVHHYQWLLLEKWKEYHENA
jgi:hypothetical protein